MPYAYGATIEHEFDVDHLNVWLTFRHPMNQDVKPAHDLWTLTVDDVEKAISSSAWQDEHTLLLVSDAVVTYPDRVLLAYGGPDENLRTTWGKQWEPWGDILSIDIGKGKCYVHRGDPSDYDFEASDLTIDNAWHELDLSGIVPEYAKAVHLAVGLDNGYVGRYIQFRHTGQSNYHNRALCKTQVSNNSLWFDIVQALDADRKIDYYGSPGGWNYILIVIRGWWF